MKTFLFAFSLAIAGVFCSTTSWASEEPIQHLKLAEVTSLDEAVRVFSETTAELQGKNELDANHLHDIHMITYSLEKAIAYFVENMKDDQQAEAQKMAEVVEMVHIASENNRASETGANLDEYFRLAEAFATDL